MWTLSASCTNLSRKLSVDWWISIIVVDFDFLPDTETNKRQDANAVVSDDIFWWPVLLKAEMLVPSDRHPFRHGTCNNLVGLCLNVVFNHDYHDGYDWASTTVKFHADKWRQPYVMAHQSWTFRSIRIFYHTTGWTKVAYSPGTIIPVRISLLVGHKSFFINVLLGQFHLRPV